MSDRPLVTVLIPARNEVRDIASCIEHVAAQHYPLDRIEVVVVDGASTDGTVSAAEEALAGHAFHHAAVLTNREGTTPSNLNVGLRYATGEIVCRVDARTRIEPQYVRTCVDVLTNRPDVSVVGGSQRAIARDASALANGIARALNNRYTMGGSPYRRALTSGPSDTVYLGAFRRSDLLEVHGWDERLPTNQDFDLNRRMAERGTVWFDASLRSGYVPRATLRELRQQYVRFGQGKVRYWRVTASRPNGRQWGILAGTPLLALALAALGLRHPLPMAAAAGSAAALVDSIGSDRRAPLPVRAVAAVASGIVGVSWLTGIARELARR
jgi:succinoglycan biosynthesis protein ExoA